ncbi:MAG: helix-turn-helix transcriptional regulator [Kofleriaceae bacterium]
MNDDALRRRIAKRVRELRAARTMTQTELSRDLGISQNWLSQLERGEGSFTAEQFLRLLQLFNVSVNEFVPPKKVSSELQNALVRLGAKHLQRADNVYPSEQLEDYNRVAIEVLVEASPRAVTALAPILALHANDMILWRVQADLTHLGLASRFPWAVENTLRALEILKRTHPALAAQYEKSEPALRRFLQSQDRLVPEAFDLLDRNIHSEKTIEEVRSRRSEVSQRWNIVTSLRPEDFARAIEASA